MKPIDINKTKRIAELVRHDIVEMTHKAGPTGAHIGGSLSCVEILTVLYNGILHYDIDDMGAPSRDRLIFSKGHAAMTLYSVLHKVGILPTDEFDSFKVDGSFIASHPHMDDRYGIEFSSGSLGLGLSQAVGMALALRMKGNTASKIFVFQGDGECEEGSVWESAMSASNYNLNNIILIIDRNKLQLDGRIEDIMSLGDFSSKWSSFGWNVTEVDGHNLEGIYESLSNIINFKTSKPSVLIANTIKGKGISFIENQAQWHVNMLSEKLYKQAIEELEQNGIK